MKFISCNLVSIICVVCSFAALYMDFDGWGWFLFVAVLFGHTFGDKGKEDEQ